MVRKLRRGDPSFERLPATHHEVLRWLLAKEREIGEGSLVFYAGPLARGGHGVEAGGDIYPHRNAKVIAKALESESMVALDEAGYGYRGTLRRPAYLYEQQLEMGEGEEHHFIVQGRGFSRRGSAASRRRYAAKIQEAARPVLPAEPTAMPVSLRVDYYYHTSHNLDGDNLLSVVSDALTGVAYGDDEQIRRHEVNRTNIDGSYRIDDPPFSAIWDVLAVAGECVAITLRILGE